MKPPHWNNISKAGLLVLSTCILSMAYTAQLELSQDTGIIIGLVSGGVAAWYSLSRWELWNYV